MPRPGETCYTCGAPAVSDDHIPAKCLFPVPRPADLQLITVPSCDAHNHERGGDDDYFRLIMTTCSADDPAAERWIDRKVLTYLKRNPEFLKDFLAGSVARVPITTPGGIFLEYRPAFTYDRPRLQKVVDAYARGLWFHENRQELPQEVPVWPFALNPLWTDWYAEIVPRLAFHKSTDGTFLYRMGYFENDRTCSLIVLMFYGKTVLVTGTGDVNAIAPPPDPATPA